MRYNCSNRLNDIFHSKIDSHKMIFNVPNFRKRIGLLNESLGVKELENINFQNRLKSFISKKIISFLNISDKIFDSEILIDNEWKCGFKMFEFESNLTWNKSINIFMTENSSELLSFILCDELLSDSRIIDYKIKKDGDIFYSYKMNGDYLEYFSIILNIPEYHKTNIDELFSIIFHEIQHAFRLYRKNFLNNAINSDILYFNNYEDIYSNMKYLRYRDYEIQELDEENIFYIFRNLSYYLNLSEIEARRANFYVECLNKKCSIENCSTDYQIYSLIKMFLEKLKEYVSEKCKNEFVKKYLDIFYDIYLRNDDLKNSHSQFKWHGKYSYKSFDILMNFFIYRIENQYIKKCKRIYRRNNG